MRQLQLIAFACLCAAGPWLASGAPLPASDQELDVLQIPLSNDQELDVLTLGSRAQEQLIAERNKRTVGLLRELFPDITKQIDGIVNRIIAQVIRVAGPSLLPTLLGNRGGAGRSTTESNGFDSAFDDIDEDEDDDDEENGNGNGNAIGGTDSTTDGGRVQIDLRAYQPFDFGNAGEATNATTPASDADSNSVAKNNGASDTAIDLSAINKQLEETIRVARQVKEAEAAAAALQQQQLSLVPQPQLPQAQQQIGLPLNIPSQLPIPKSNNEPIQLSFNNEVVPSLAAVSDNSKAVNNDLQQTESKSPAIDELTLDSNEDTADLDDRNKRFLQFGGAGLAGGSSSGSSGSSGGNAAGGGGAAPGGSGNFLFDIVRLFSGSVQTQAGDEAANSANSVSGDGDSDGDSDANRAADGYTEGIPGPVTRLVVLANRGLANLIQDLILRIAATSEKFVNFKAKLITALI